MNENLKKNQEAFSTTKEIIKQRDLNESFMSNSGVNTSSVNQPERTLIGTKTSKPIITKMTKETLKAVEDWYHIAIGEGETNPSIMHCFHRDMAYYMDMLNKANRDEMWPGEDLSAIARSNPPRFFTLMRRLLGDTSNIRDPQFLSAVQRRHRLSFRDAADVQSLVSWLQVQRTENNVTPQSVDESGRSIENQAVKDLLKKENPISIKGTPPDTLMREFHIDKDIRLDAFNEKLLKVTFKIFQNLNKAAELLGYASSREMLECQSRKDTQKKPIVISTSSKTATVTGNKVETSLNQIKQDQAGRGNPQKQGQGRGGGPGRGEKKQLPDCYGCGRRGHTRDPRPAEGQSTGCAHCNRPHFNKENTLWRRSTNGQIFVNQQIALGNPLYTRETFEKTWWPVLPIDSTVVIPHIVKPDSNKKQKGMHIALMKIIF